jgi:hypothetical protein
MGTGQAAGVAAAMAAAACGDAACDASAADVRTVDTAALISRLRDMGAVLPRGAQSREP